MSSQSAIHVLMVCLGNICRSPTAEAVLRKQLQNVALDKVITVDSAGTSNWHPGEAPDSRSIKAAAQRGYELAHLRARQIVATDFTHFDYILAMDQQNLVDLQRICPPPEQHKLALLLSHGSTGVIEVPDPYDRNSAAFDTVLDLCENACAALLQQLIMQHQLSPIRSQG